MTKRGKKTAVIPPGECVACGCCLKACPTGAIRIVRGVYALVDESKCIGCGACAKLCPASIIEMEVRP